MKSKFVLIIVSIFYLLSPSAHGADDRENMIHKIINAQELPRQFEAQTQQTNAYLRSTGEKMMESLQNQAGGKIPPKANKVFQDYFSELSLSSSEELVNVWSSYFFQDLTADELKIILDFYESPVGKKTVIATEKANSEFTKWFLSKQQANVKARMDKLMSELDAAMRP